MKLAITLGILIYAALALAAYRFMAWQLDKPEASEIRNQEEPPCRS